MSRPDPIQYAERLYSAIRAANFSPMSFLAFGNAVKDGVDLRRMPRIAAEPFMRIVGEMLDIEEDAANAEIVNAEILERASLAPDELDGGGAPGRSTTTSTTTGEDGPSSGSGGPTG